MNKILIINGPNLNYLGKRQPHIYGKHSLSDIESLCRIKAKEYSYKLDFRQTNHEGVIIDWLYEADGQCEVIIINPGAYCHYSIAILDAIEAISSPVIEVHISDISKREIFRQESITSSACFKTITGLGYKVYEEAIEEWVTKK